MKKSTERARPSAPPVVRIVLWVTLLLLYAPIFLMVANSFIEPTGDLGLKWYLLIFNDSDLIDALMRTLGIAFMSSILAVGLALFASVAIHRSRFYFSGSLTKLALHGVAIPELVFALSLMTFFSIANIPFGISTIIVAHVTFILSFVILTLNARLETLDPTFDDAARDLGASEWQVFTRITVPLLRPALAAGFILGFLLSFDDFLVTFFNAGAGSDTLPIKLYSNMRFGLTPKLSALASLMFLMSCLLVLITVSVNRRRD